MHGRIGIIDYGVGNVHSVAAALSSLGYAAVTTRDPDVIRSADALILPGVGAFAEAMTTLEQLDLVGLLDEQVCVKRKPILGICLGMQLFGHSSEESPGQSGLGWLDFTVRAIPKSVGVKVPHVGWNTVEVSNHLQLFKNLEREPHFYFDHSYYADCDEDLIAARCDYGTSIPAVVVRDNIVGIQCHPEKSQVNGLKVFRNYFSQLGI